MTDTSHVYVVILAGGGGTRLWPKSRNQTPKQFLKLMSDKTMLQETAERLLPLVPWERMIIVTNQNYLDEVQSELPQVPKINIIAEPQKRDTALAMLTGALFAQLLDPEAIVVNAASDHLVKDQKEFVRVMEAAVQVAQRGQNLITVGITPTFPSSGFGYIKIGEDQEKIMGNHPVFKVQSFTEKPNVATARAFIATGKYFWNANMYVWSSAALAAAFQQHFPSMYQLTQSLTNLQPAEFHKQLPQVYSSAESISIDYAISEKANNLVLIPGDFGWNDVGDWKVVYDLSKKDQQGNVILGEQKKGLILESKHNLVHTNGRLVALYGIENMIVIDTEEILMIIPKAQSQDVKKIVEDLKNGKQEEYL